MVDFSLQPFEEMIKLFKIFNDKFIWIDHHISAINDELTSNIKIKGIRKVGEAACELTWQYFFLKKKFLKSSDF